MARHVHRNLTAAERARSKQAREAFVAEQEKIVATGRRVFERHEHLQETLRALRAQREAQGVSLAELERRTGMSKASLSRLENDPDANPTILTLSRIAAALGKTIRVVLEDEQAAA